jgi:hypothetical protein
MIRICLGTVDVDFTAEVPTGEALWYQADRGGGVAHFDSRMSRRVRP